MANLGGTAVAIPQAGEHFSNGLYVARCILGFAATTASGSEGYDRWTDTQETVPLFDINATDIIVHSLYRDVETAFTASVTITLGDGANAGGFMDAVTLAATVISSGQLSEDTNANQEYLMGKWYKTTDAIDAVVGGADPAVGKMSVYVVYSHAGSLPVPDSGGSSNT
jgi:hypothetical protein